MPGGLRQAAWGTLSTLMLLVASSCLFSVHALRYQDLGKCLLPRIETIAWPQGALSVPCQACLEIWSQARNIKLLRAGTHIVALS